MPPIPFTTAWRRRPLAAGTALAFVLLSGSAADAAPDSRPNILFFLTDDQPHDLMGAAGHPILKTPTIDRLATQGLRFDHMFVTTPICAASRASIFSGLYERAHRFTFWKPPMSRSLAAQTYPAVLREAGYYTGFVGKFGIVVEGEETRRMFDSFVPLDRPYLKEQPDGTKRHLTEITGERAIEFLKSIPAGRPFCLSVSFNAPHAEDGDRIDHYPWPQSVDGLYDKVPIPAPKLADPAIFERHPPFLKSSLNRERWYWRWDTAEKYDRNIRAYYRMISGIDLVMERILQELDRLELAATTIVIFSSDNGYYLGSRGFAGKWSHYEESLRVPLIIFDPRLAPSIRGRVVSEMALNVDLPATILDFAGIPIPDRYQGESLAPWVLNEPPGSWRVDFFAEHLAEHEHLPKWEGVRNERYVYARYFEQEPVFEFLHDLEADPDQLENLAGDPAYEAVLSRLRSRCDELRDRYGGRYER